MLSKKYRLPTSFFRARKRPVASFVVGGVGVRAYATELLYPRCAAVVPIKAAKNAVERNMIRRTIYDIVRLYITEIPVFNIVFFVSHAENIKTDTQAAIQKLFSL